MSRPSLLDEAPKRPALGVLFGVGVSAWFAALFAECLSWQLYVGELDTSIAVHMFMFAAILLLLVSTLVRVFAQRMQWAHHIWRTVCAFVRSGAMLSCIAFCVVCWTSLLYWNAWAGQTLALRELFASGEMVRIELSGDPVVRDYGTVSNARLAQALDGIDTSANLRVLWPEGVEALSAGQLINVSGSMREIKQDEGGRWNHQNGFVGMVQVAQVQELGYAPGLQGLVARFRDASFTRIESLGGDTAALLAGILLGDRVLYAGTELEQSFKTTGLAHLMAVSGTHLAVVSMLIVSLLSALKVRQVSRNAFTLCMLVLYVALTGFSLSAIRSCAMCGIALMAASAKRRKHIISALSLSVFLFVGLSPSIAFSLGFTLSVLAVGGLVVFGPLFQVWFVHIVPAKCEKGAAAVSATCAATFLTLPVTVPLFAQMPLISPVSNLIAAPLVSGTLIIGIPALLAYEILPPVGELLLHVSGAIAGCCARVVHALAQFPLACVPLDQQAYVLSAAFAIAALVLWILWPLPHASLLAADRFGSSLSRKGMRARVPLLALFFVGVIAFAALASGFGKDGSVVDPDASRIVMIDVGQGDCMLIESKQARVLVDTGEEGDVLQRGLARQGITHLDAVFITHKDIDHCGALRKLAGVVSVDHVFVHADLLDKEFEAQVLDAALWVTKGKGAEGIRPGSRFEVGEFTMTLLAPEHGGESENEDSLVNLVEYDAGHDGTIEARGLLTGDAEADATKNIVKGLGHIDALKVPHHGSKDAVTKEELEEMSPCVALIGVGAGNKYGHPARETLRQLEQSGTRVYRTDTQGDIIVEFSQDTMRVFTQR